MKVSKGSFGCVCAESDRDGETGKEDSISIESECDVRWENLYVKRVS